MKKYLGFDVPVLNKEVENYLVIGDDNYATHARIIYKDGTEFNMEKGLSDVSGIYGATLVKEEKIDNVNVKFYKYEFENTKNNYIIWEINGFSYSYSNDNNEITENEVTELIKLTK